MRFPEFLYQLSARDQQVTWLDPFFSNAESTGAAAALSANITPDRQRTFILSSLSANAFVTGAATVAALLLLAVPPQGNPQFAIAQTSSAYTGGGAAGTQLQLNWSGELIIPPGWILRATALYSAAVAGNEVEMTAGGILIPAGNIQRV